MSLCAISSKCHALARMFHARICCLLFVQVLCTGTRRRLASFAHHVHVNVILLLFCLSQVTCSHSCSRFAVLLSFRANVHYSTRMLVRLALCLGKCMRTCNWCVVVVVFGAVACQLFDYLTLLCLGSRTRSSAEAFASIVEID